MLHFKVTIVIEWYTLHVLKESLLHQIGNGVGIVQILELAPEDEVCLKVFKFNIIDPF